MAIGKTFWGLVRTNLVDWVVLECFTYETNSLHLILGCKYTVFYEGKVLACDMFNTNIYIYFFFNFETSLYYINNNALADVTIISLIIEA